MTTPAVRFRVDFGHQAAVGPGKIALLEHIGSSGSLSQAARELGMSYRRAWQLLENLNDCFLRPVTASARGGRGGGGAQLTDFGVQLIRAYRALETEVQAYARRSLRPIAREARAAARTGSPRSRRARAPLLPRRGH
jgi:molybdate transport system regulatory protein